MSGLTPYVYPEFLETCPCKTIDTEDNARGTGHRDAHNQTVSASMMTERERECSKRERDDESDLSAS